MDFLQSLLYVLPLGFLHFSSIVFTILIGTFGIRAIFCKNGFPDIKKIYKLSIIVLIVILWGYIEISIDIRERANADARETRREEQFKYVSNDLAVILKKEDINTITIERIFDMLDGYDITNLKRGEKPFVEYLKEKKIEGFERILAKNGEQLTEILVEFLKEYEKESPLKDMVKGVNERVIDALSKKLGIEMEELKSILGPNNEQLDKILKIFFEKLGINNYELGKMLAENNEQLIGSLEGLFEKYDVNEIDKKDISTAIATLSNQNLKKFFEKHGITIEDIKEMIDKDKRQKMNELRSHFDTIVSGTKIFMEKENNETQAKIDELKKEIQDKIGNHVCKMGECNTVGGSFEKFLEKHGIKIANIKEMIDKDKCQIINELKSYFDTTVTDTRKFMEKENNDTQTRIEELKREILEKISNHICKLGECNTIGGDPTKCKEIEKTANTAIEIANNTKDNFGEFEAQYKEEMEGINNNILVQKILSAILHEYTTCLAGATFKKDKIACEEKLKSWGY